MPPPVNPHAIQPARDQLAFLYQTAGRVTLSGQHNEIGRMSAATDRVKALTGKTPFIWGSDFGFSGTPGDIDYLGDRVKLFPEIQKQYAQGALIVLTYHQGNPATGEPCAFRGGVQSRLTDEEWRRLITPGTPLHGAWQRQMDVLAALFHQLEAAAIPVIFRPYHEMNGDWFWWGRRPGPEGYTLLWRQLYHYYTEVHGLNNLLWAWCTDRPWEGIEAYYPGAGCVDIVGADIYPKTGYADVYRQEWHDRLRALAEGKPVALTENSLIPDEATLETQPWAWFMCWGGLTFRAHSGAELKACYDSPRVASLEDRSKL